MPRHHPSARNTPHNDGAYSCMCTETQLERYRCTTSYGAEDFLYLRGNPSSSNRPSFVFLLAEPTTSQVGWTSSSSWQALLVLLGFPSWKSKKLTSHPPHPRWIGSIRFRGGRHVRSEGVTLGRLPRKVGARVCQSVDTRCFRRTGLRRSEVGAGARCRGTPNVPFAAMTATSMCWRGRGRTNCPA